MSLRTLTTLSVICVAFCLFAPSAHAQQEGCGERCAQSPEGGFTGWGEPDSGFNPPTPERCYARASQNQACHVCAEHAASPGHPAGWFCDWTVTDAGCACPPTGCSPTVGTTGSCTYYNGF